jgi:hypothetical protein
MQGDFSNADLVQFIELAGSFLFPTIPDYAKKYSLSYNGVKNIEDSHNFNTKYVIDND